MAHQAADGSKWTNASQARRVPGRAQGDGKQPVARFSKPEAPREATASPVASDPTSQGDQYAEGSSSDQDHAPAVEVTQDGNMFVVTAKYGSEQEANAAAQSLQGSDQMSAQHDVANPAQGMM